MMQDLTAAKLRSRHFIGLHIYVFLSLHSSSKQSWFEIFLESVWLKELLHHLLQLFLNPLSTKTRNSGILLVFYSNLIK